VGACTIRITNGAAPPEARAIRERVFVAEQGVALEEEWDEHDAPGAATLHLVAFEDARAVGCARVRSRGDAVKIERVAVLAERRGDGLGRALMEAAERAARQRGRRRLVLHAQLAVIPFYERLGFEAHGPAFQEAGIPHRAMAKTLA
jgi:predicted GNAT family N-acyltransferase